jgi:hypothetical protein
VHRHLFAAAVLIAVICMSRAIGARPVELWSAERLWKEADLVLIGVAKETADSAVYRGGARKPDSWVQVETTFAIERVLQGEHEGKRVPVLHHRFFEKEAESEVIDGPSFVEFDAKKKQRYLIFLKQAEGEKNVYEPLTGQYDPDQSFQRLMPYHVTSER